MNYPDWQREIRLAQAKRQGKPEPECFDALNVVIFRSILYQLGIKAEVNSTLLELPRYTISLDGEDNRKFGDPHKLWIEITGAPYDAPGRGFSVPVDYPLTEAKQTKLRARFADALDTLDAEYGERLRNV